LTRNQLDFGYQKELQNKLNKLCELEKNEYKELFALKEKAIISGDMTFKDLDLLQSIDPEKFKGLIITATRQDNLKLTIFNVENSPNIEIADAVRASSSIPLFFTPYEINNIKYIDGGLNDNTPIDYFRKNMNGSDYKKMIIFSFEFYTNHISPIHSNLPHKIDNKTNKFMIDLLPNIISSVIKDQINTYNELQKYPLETIILDVNNIGILSFDKAHEEFIYLYNRAYLQTTKYLENHDFIKEKDQNFGIKNLILNLYKEISQPSWSDNMLSYLWKVKSKCNFILDFIKEEYLKTQSDEALINKFIKIICKKNPDGNLDFNNPIMKKFIDLLNQSDIESNVKGQFISFLKIPKFDQKFDLDPEQINKAIFEFKFDQKSFEDYFNQTNLSGITDIQIEE
jgi:predicted acylesterase/phospholipase RssA